MRYFYRKCSTWQLLAIFLFTAGHIYTQSGFSVSSYTTNVNCNRFTNPEFDNNGDAWMACSSSSSTLTADVFKFDGSNWTALTSPFCSISGNRNNTLAFDPVTNKLWLGSKNGVGVYDGTAWTTYTASNSSLLHNDVHSIAFEGSNVWIGTLGGLSKLNGTNWTSYTKANGSLPNDSVLCIGVDGTNDIWLGQNNYLTHYNGNTFSPNFIAASRVVSVAKQGPDHYITVNAKLLKFNGTSFVNVSDKCPDILTSPNATSATVTNPGTLLVTIKDIGIYKLENDSAWKPWFFEPIFFGGAPASMYSKIHPSNGKIYVATILFPGNKPGFLILDTTQYNGLGLGPAKGANERNLKYLDGNLVKAPITNRGDRFYNFLGSQYEAPKGSGTHPALISSLWLGGKDNMNNLHVAAQTYRIDGNDFWPGPLDTTNVSIDSATAWKYDKVWKVDRQMIYDFQQAYMNGNVQNGTYKIPEDILTWPAHGSGNQAKNLAPFYDANGDGIYNPQTNGDYPIIKGDQSIYSIFNDKLSAHGQTGGTPLGVEVHYEAYVFYCSQIADSLNQLNYATFHDYTIINRSSYAYDSVYAGLWNDADIGWYLDDLIGCEPSENFGMTYNAYNYDPDGNGITGYHDKCPIFSSAILNGPPAYPGDGLDNNNNGQVDEPAEICLLTNFMFYNTSTGPIPMPTFQPNSPDEYYDHIRSIWLDSTHITECWPLSGSVVSNFYNPYPASASPPCNNTTFLPRDTRMISGIGPFSLAAGQSVNITEALVFTQDTSTSYNVLDSALFAKNRKNVRLVRDWYNNNNFPGCYLWSGMASVLNTAEITLFPNPARNFITIKSSESFQQVEICNIEGKCVMQMQHPNAQNLLNVSTEKLSAGIYFMKITCPTEITVKKFIINR